MTKHYHEQKYNQQSSLINGNLIWENDGGCVCMADYSFEYYVHCYEFPLVIKDKGWTKYEIFMTL